MKRIDKNTVIIEKSGDMKTDSIIFINDKLEQFLEESATKQISDVACLDGIRGNAMAMPDIHSGYGFPIGGVAGFDTSNGIISPGGVGYDINCGVRFLKTNLTEDDISAEIKNIASAIFSNIPSGVGSSGSISIKKHDFISIMKQGAHWPVSKGMGCDEDIDNTQLTGRMPDADPASVSEKAVKRGLKQQSTLGSGNHFVELQVVDSILDNETAQKWGLFKGQAGVMIHTGSRGFGHQICTDTLKYINNNRYGLTIPNRQLASVPFDSEEGRKYFSAMKCASNYAWCNRQIIMHKIRDVLTSVLSISPQMLGADLLYDVSHNIALVEEHSIDGVKEELIVHRKGATRSFGPGDSRLPPRFRNTGQPVIIPGDMGTASYIMKGMRKAMDVSLGSTCHGAGRIMSRKGALKKMSASDAVKEMRSRNVYVLAASNRTIREEMPEAYKDISDVISTVHNAGLSSAVARLRPLAVIKG
ncbi:MAG: RtcB family protein [candidate division WOR-3 bacterium]|nr:RtcB family protein [candidate division WOR-3 bacterium]